MVGGRERLLVRGPHRLRLRRRRENEGAIAGRHEIEAPRHDAGGCGPSAPPRRSCRKAAKAASGGRSRPSQLARASTSVRGRSVGISLFSTLRQSTPRIGEDIADEQKERSGAMRRAGPSRAPKGRGRRAAPERPARPRLAAWFVIACARRRRRRAPPPASPWPICSATPESAPASPRDARPRTWRRCGCLA